MPDNATSSGKPEPDTRCYSPSWFVENLPNLEDSIKAEQSEWIKSLDAVTNLVPGEIPAPISHLRQLVENDPIAAATAIKEMYPTIVSQSYEAATFRLYVGNMRELIQGSRPPDRRHDGPDYRSSLEL